MTDGSTGAGGAPRAGLGNCACCASVLQGLLQLSQRDVEALFQLLFLELQLRIHLLLGLLSGSQGLNLTR